MLTKILDWGHYKKFRIYWGHFLDLEEGTLGAEKYRMVRTYGRRKLRVLAILMWGPKAFNAILPKRRTNKKAR